MSPSIVLDLGGTVIKLALVHDGDILETADIRVSDNLALEPFLPVIEEKVSEFVQKQNISEQKLSGVGMAFPCIVDSSQNKILSEYVKYQDVNDLNLEEWCSRRWSISLIMENDAHAALMGEWKYGAGTGYDNIVLVTIGTGVGSAVLMDGKLLRGKHYLAGNLGGHVTIDYRGKLCNCGNIGCVESVASTWALPEIVKDRPGYKKSKLGDVETLDFRRVFEAAQTGDDFAIKLRDDCIKAWSFGVVNLVHSYDPEIVIMGGGILESQEVIIPQVQGSVDRHSWLPAGTVLVSPATHKHHAALLGMDYLIRNKGRE